MCRCSNVSTAGTLSPQDAGIFMSLFYQLFYVTCKIWNFSAIRPADDLQPWTYPADTQSRVSKIEEFIMAKSSTNSGGRGPSSHPGPGGNWPSTTGNTSGSGRGNGPAKGK